jgi:hypothetical protein
VGRERPFIELSGAENRLQALRFDTADFMV